VRIEVYGGGSKQQADANCGKKPAPESESRRRVGAIKLFEGGEAAAAGTFRHLDGEVTRAV